MNRLVFLAFAFAASSACAVQVDRVIVRQQWPWHEGILVEYSLSGVSGPVDIGVSVTKDMTRGRMERAKRLLSSTNLTVSEIAHRCGYVNGYSFMRKFKEECGQTPTEFRNRI